MRRTFALHALGLAALLARPAGAVDLEVDVAAAELGRAYDDALLRRAAGSPDAAARRAAARAGGRLGDRRALAWLVPLLDDGVGPVRRAALFALGQLGGKEIVLPVRTRLAGMEENDLPYALEALGKAKDPRAVAAVAARLRDPAAHARGAAALALWRIGDASALPDLFAAFEAEPDDRVRWKIPYAAWRLLQAAREAGRAVRVDPSWRRCAEGALAASRPFEERIFAARALGELGGDRGPLLALLDDADDRVVLAAAGALQRPWDASVAARVTGLLGREDVLLREAAIDHVAAGGPAGAALARSAWEAVAADPRLALRARVAAAAAGADVAVLADAAGAGSDAEELLWRVNSHFPARLPADAPATVAGGLAAAEVCGEERVPRELAVPVLLSLLSADDFTVRATAVSSLAKRAAVEAAPQIVAAAKSSPGTGRMDVRLEAAAALGKLGAFDPWLEEAAAADPDRQVREAAREALAALGRAAPPERGGGGFRLHGLGAEGILETARALRGTRVLLETTRGSIEMVLLPDEAPAHCVNFAALVAKGFYDGLTWHRVVPDFVIQGGCPRGDGAGGPGYLLPDEIGTRPYVRGTVGMPRSGPDTGGCQVFVTHLPTPHLDGRYTVFAQVVVGLDVVDRIRVGDRIVSASLGQ